MGPVGGEVSLRKPSDVIPYGRYGTGAGASAIPTTAKAAVVNVTVTDPTSDGFLTVWPCGSPQPLASNLNYSAGQTIPNLVISQLGTGGTICIAAQATTNIVADIDGWFA